MDVTESKQLSYISDVLLKEEVDYLELSDALKKYKELLVRLSGIDIENPDYRSDIHLSNGKALGIIWAVMCIDDVIRTKRFVKGLFQAVEHLRNLKSEPVHILYAGCGPFATLVLPLTTKYTEKEIRLTLLEVNEESIKIVKKTLSALGLNKYIDAITLADASQYKIQDGDEIDIVLSETMQRALEKESQVPIMFNLASQVQEHALLIPEKIEISLGLICFDEWEKTMKNNELFHHTKLLKIFELSKNAIAKYHTPGLNLNSMVFPEKSIHIPRSLLDRFSRLAVFTDIQVFGEEKIRLHESSLTTTLMLEDFANVTDHEIKVNIRYKVDANPGVNYEIIPLYKY